MKGLIGRLQAFAARPYLDVYAGVLLTIAGLVVMVVTWSRVAGILDVGRQIPLVISGAGTGFGLIVIGMMLVGIAAKRADARRRRAQLDELGALMTRLADRLDAEGKK